MACYLKWLGSRIMLFVVALLMQFSMGSKAVKEGGKQRFVVDEGSVMSRDSGDVQGHPNINIVQGDVKQVDGVRVVPSSKYVGRAWDTMGQGSWVFLKCEPVGGVGKVEGLHGWKGREAEEAVRGDSFVLTADEVTDLPDGGGQCGVYQWAVPLEQVGPLKSWDERIELLVHVYKGLGALHRAGFAHRDIKTSNIMRKGSKEWAIGDLDAAGRIGDVIDEFMGFPWSVWGPNVQIGPWPNAVPPPENIAYIRYAWNGQEQARGVLRVTKQMDMFQFGMLLIKILCGIDFLIGKPGRDVLALLGSPEPLKIPVECLRVPNWIALENITVGLLSKDPGARDAAWHDAEAALSMHIFGVQSVQDKVGEKIRCEDVDYCYNVKI